ncbi:hypothetical protein [Candidatus Blastococcus massiliensis]|uniref:hypothetical protein n=1 Tax=Candidatus Blastococcus massiliensis TaxID=1470358 RepID=UPI0004B6DB65|nr:hypothetical protein [Candidatus Blastococcus massiliensis]
MNRTRLAPLVLAGGLALALAACGDDEPDTQSAPGPAATSAATSAAGGDADRYCELTAELEAIGEGIFADVPEDAGEEEYMRREQQLLEQGSAQFEELERVAPEEIADDVPVMLDGIRARAATGEDPNQDAASAAEERVLAWEEENCA